MSHLNDSNGSDGSNEQNDKPISPRAPSISELLRENNELKFELLSLQRQFRDTQIRLDAALVQGLPTDEVEMNELLESSVSISDLLRGLEPNE